MIRPVFPSLFAAIVGAILLGACGGGGGSSTLSNSVPSPAPSPAVSSVPKSFPVSVPLSDVGVPIALPDVGPFEGDTLAETIWLPSNNAPAGTKALIGVVPSGVPDPDPSFGVTGASITLPVTVTFTGAIKFSVLDLDGGGIYGGAPFTVEYYDPTVGAWKVIGGGEFTSNDNETLIAFSGPSGSATLKAGITYSFGLWQACPYCY